MSDETKPEAPAEKSPVEANKDWLDKFGDAHKMLGQIYQIMKAFGPEYERTVESHEDRADARQEAWSEKAEAAAEERNREQCAAMILQGYIVRHGMDKDSVELAVRAANQLRAELIRTRFTSPRQRAMEAEGDEGAP